jgi:transposase-like protein
MSIAAAYLNHTHYPSDVIALVVLWRLRYRLTLRDLAEMFLVRGLTFSHEAVREWEAKLAPVLADELRRRRHGSYPRAIHSVLGRRVVHQSSAYKNNGLEQDHLRFCRSYDELRDFLRPRTRHNQHVPASRRRLLHLRRATTALAALEAA